MKLYFFEEKKKKIEEEIGFYTVLKFWTSFLRFISLEYRTIEIVAEEE